MDDFFLAKVQLHPAVLELLASNPDLRVARIDYEAQEIIIWNRRERRYDNIYTYLGYSGLVEVEGVEFDTGWQVHEPGRGQGSG